MTGSLVTRIDTSHRQRSLRWALQALLVVFAAHLAIAFLVSAVLPLVLDSPLRRLSRPRARILGLAARILCVVAVGIQSAYLSTGMAAITATVLAAVIQTGLVFAAAYVVSRILDGSLRSPRTSN